MAVLPAPMMTADLPMETGVSWNGNLSPPMRLTRVRNSLAE